MYECKICGKTDKTVELLLGGIVGYAHQECVKNLDKLIDIFLEFVVTTPDGAVYLAEELIKARDRVYQRSEGMGG